MACCGCNADPRHSGDRKEPPMPDDLIPRLPMSVVLPRGASRRQLLSLNSRVGFSRAEIRARRKVGEWAAIEVVDLKVFQQEMEQAHPDATEAIAIIVNATLRGILRSVEAFNSELD